MKVVLVVLFLALAVPVLADVRVQNNMISAEVNGEPLRQVIDKMKSQTHVNFFVDDSVSSTSVSASFQDLSLGEGIKKMLEGTGINYAVVGGNSGSPDSVYIGGSEKPGACVPNGNIVLGVLAIESPPWKKRATCH